MFIHSFHCNHTSFISLTAQHSLYLTIWSLNVTVGFVFPDIGDVDGSVEAILDVLATYTSNQCRLHILHFGVGNITEQDVEMAALFSG